MLSRAGDADGQIWYAVDKGGLMGANGGNRTEQRFPYQL